jgi:hypothetical protein
MSKKTKTKRSAEFYGSKTKTGGQAAPEDQDKVALLTGLWLIEPGEEGR